MVIGLTASYGLVMTEQTPENDPPATAQVGVVGLAVMGSNLARNFAHHGYTVALYNRTQARTDELVAAHGHEGSFVPTASPAAFAAALQRPRRALIMVKAGAPTDAMIDALVPHLEPGDIVVDGGNAHFEDTRRREARLRELGLHFVGTGVSGGEEGALNGPSIMPGGSRESYEALGPLLEDISAISVVSRPAPRRTSYASAMNCMSAYSMPLWTILTKWPAPSGPM